MELPPSVDLTPEQRELLEAFTAQLGVVAEKERLAQSQRRAQVMAESERLQKTLFDTVSHELKTPISAISAALEQSDVDRLEIQRANERLRRTVDQLLDATRIESGMLKLTYEWCDPEELALEACRESGISPDKIHLECRDALPPIRADAALVKQALYTLLYNAATHGSSREPVTLLVHRGGDSMLFEVADRGPGLPLGSEEKVFERFFRAPGSATGGVGLGLSIARRLAEVHGGTITAENRPSGGAQFILRLPIGGELRYPNEADNPHH